MLAVASACIGINCMHLLNHCAHAASQLTSRKSNPVACLPPGAAAAGAGDTFIMQLSTVLGAAIPEERHENKWIEGVAIWVAIFLVTIVSE
jgi:hypothetical protein